MTGDFTRNTFDPKKSYTSVRMQQGRLFSDADWNEQADIYREFHRSGLRGVIGASGFPADNAGFKLRNIPGTKNFVIDAGVAYVEGIEVQADPVKAISFARVGSGSNRRWRHSAIPNLEVGDLLAPDPDNLNQLHQVTEASMEESGSQLVNVSPPFANIPSPSAVKLVSLTTQKNIELGELPNGAGSYLMYLDVWERSLGAIEDPNVVETAFGGVDTAGRDKLIWQVKYIEQSELEMVADPISCASFIPGWSLRDKDVLIKARAQAGQALGDVCTLPPAAGYRSLENHLYRVEIHNPGSFEGDDATFKWSRDNAIHRTRYDVVDSGDLIVDSIGRDDKTALKVGDWLEIKDEARILSSEPGFFARISEVNDKRIGLAEILDPITLTPLTDNGAPDVAKLPTTAHVIRWEGGQPAKLGIDWVALENGIEVDFFTGVYASGDYWTIPARSLTGDIEWPMHPTQGEPLAKGPDGIGHAYAALGLVDVDAAGAVTIEDCRRLFAPLTEQKQFYYLGGDGQEALPDILQPNQRIDLLSPLRVGVIRGRTPVAGERIRFTVIGGQGLFENNSNTITAGTQADGQALARWSVDSLNLNQQVQAELLDSNNLPTHAPIIFSAALSRAEETSYDPANTPTLAGADTVQKAIELLAGMQQIGCSTHVITKDMDWVSVLKSIAANENASVCFAPGEYTANDTLSLNNLGHISISGAGDGTKIVVRGTECGLSFANCASVTIHDINISAPDDNESISKSRGRRGTVTTDACASVDIYDCHFDCGAGPRKERTCLTVGGGAKPMESARIYRNRLAAGYYQDAILVTDCKNTMIERNEISTLPRPVSLAIEKLTADAKWRNGMVNVLVASPEIDAFAAGGGHKTLRGGRFTASFKSAIPQAEWDALIKEFPPAETDVKNKTAFKGFADKLVDRAVEKPSLLPSFKKQGERFGQQSFRNLDRKVKRNILTATELDVAEFFAGGRAKKKNVILEINGARLAMNSPIKKNTWVKALVSTGRVDKVEDGKTLLAQTKAIAQRFLKDKGFRDQFPDVVEWLKSTVDTIDKIGGEGIVCAGKVLDSVKISHNLIDTFQVGIRVATSFKFGNKFLAGSVELMSNRLRLQAHSDGAYMPYGLLVGNAETIRIERNDLSFADEKKASIYNQGVRVWGILGDFIAIRENRISVSRVGIKVVHVEPPDDSRWHQMQWIAADNLADHPKLENVLVSMPRAMVDRNNKPLNL